MMKALKLIILCLSLLLSNDLKSQNATVSELDATIDKLIPKAKKNKLNEKQINLLTSSYHQANQEDHQRIIDLKKSGQPDIWIEIYYRINKIDNRQNKIKALPDNIKNSMNFKVLNLDNEIKNSREKAELYIYAKTKLLLKDINESNLNEAEYLVNHLCKINPQSNNIDELKLKLAILPAKRILLTAIILPESNLPNEFEKIINDFDETTIYGIPFDTIRNKNTDYDLSIFVIVADKTISPERMETVTFEERNGDKAAKVTDKTMSKSANISGKIVFYDVKTGKILISTPFDIGSTFVYKYAEMVGDKEACSAKTLQLLGAQPIDFPSDEALLKDAARNLNQTLKKHYQKK